jgi:hypothetical protein
MATACIGGNQELVERKTTELISINEQVAKQAAPAGLKEGSKVEVKATVRVERSPEKAAVVRDVKIDSVQVDGKIRDPSAAEKQQAEGSSGVRQERLHVAATGGPPPELKNQPAEGVKTAPTSAVSEVKVPAEGTPGFRQEHLNVPSVNEK